MDIKHIVVGADFSPESDAAAKHALNIARLAGAEITLVHACPVVEPPSGTVSTQWTELMQQHLAKNRRKLEELRAYMSGQGPRISHMVIDEVPDAGLVDSAAKLDADLVIVGTHGFTAFKRVLLGSVAERVIRRSEASVLVARPAEHLAGGYRRILVPTDFSDGARRALEMATKLAAKDAHIDARHWWHSPYGGPMPDPASLREQIETHARAAGQELIEPFQSSAYQLSFDIAEAPPKYGIERQLAQGDYDLVVMGSHGRRGIVRWLIGSVAEATARHAPCSVLVVR